ncbi:DUF4116 domain-containing protein [Flavobacteriaceae bacterium]|nr:DUF4116 domain-containing protein [Flavobacteriaceae bacterium]
MEKCWSIGETYPIEVIAKKNWTGQYFCIRFKGFCCPLLSQDKKSITKSNTMVKLNKNLWQKYQVDVNSYNEVINAIKEDTDYIKNVKEPTEEMQLIAIRQNPLILEKIKNPTEKVCLEAIETFPSLIRHIKNPSEKLCFTALNTALERDDDVFSHIENPTEEMQIIAVRTSISAYKSISSPSEKVSIAFVSIPCKCTTLHDVSEQTEAICMAAVRAYSQNLEYAEKQTEEMCLIAVEDDWETLAYADYRTEKVCMTAFKQSVYALQYFPDELTTDELRIEAIDQDPFVIHVLPDCTNDQFKYAIDKDLNVVCDIPWLDEELREYAVSKDGMLLKGNQRDQSHFVEQTDKICLAGVKQNGLAIQFVLNQTEEIALAAVEQNEKAYYYVEPKLIEENMKLEIKIKYWWACNEQVDIPLQHYEALSEDAQARIYGQTSEGMSEGELVTSVRFGKDVVPEETEDEGLSYRGYWTYEIKESITKDEGHLKLQNQLQTHINDINQIINTLPDKGDTCEESQKICLLNTLQQFEHNVNGIEKEDLIP